MIRRLLAALAALTMTFSIGLAEPVLAQEPASPAVLPDEVTAPKPPPAPEVLGDVVSRPLPRTGSDLNGTALFGGALTVVGVALALGARRRRTAFEA